MIAKTVSKKSLVNGDVEQDGSVGPVDQYKEVIRVQDNKIKELSSENENLREQLTQYSTDLEKLRHMMYELQQQNTEMKLRVSFLCNWWMPFEDNIVPKKGPCL